MYVDGNLAAPALPTTAPPTSASWGAGAVPPAQSSLNGWHRLRGARWLDVGCGTGIFTELVLDTCSPAAVFAVDPAEAQIDHACRQPVAQRANFRVADALALPFPDATFDVVASALVINFIPDRPRALSEMRRVARAGGIVAGYVWDFAAELSPSGLCASGCANSALMFHNCRAPGIRASARFIHCSSGQGLKRSPPGPST